MIRHTMRHLLTSISEDRQQFLVVTGAIGLVFIVLLVALGVYLLRKPK